MAMCNRSRIMYLFVCLCKISPSRTHAGILYFFVLYAALIFKAKSKGHNFIFLRFFRSHFRLPHQTGTDCSPTARTHTRFDQSKMLLESRSKFIRLHLSHCHRKPHLCILQPVDIWHLVFDRLSFKYSIFSARIVAKCSDGWNLGTAFLD